MLRKKGCTVCMKKRLWTFFKISYSKLKCLTDHWFSNPFYLRSAHTWYFLSGTMEHEKWFYTGFCGSQARVARNNCGSVLTT